MVLIVNEEDAETAIDVLNNAGETAFKLGSITSSNGAADVIVE